MLVIASPNLGRSNPLGYKGLLGVKEIASPVVQARNDKGIVSEK